MRVERDLLTYCEHPSAHPSPIHYCVGALCVIRYERGERRCESGKGDSEGHCHAHLMLSTARDRRKLKRSMGMVFGKVWAPRSTLCNQSNTNGDGNGTAGRPPCTLYPEGVTGYVRTHMAGATAGILALVRCFNRPTIASII